MPTLCHGPCAGVIVGAVVTAGEFCNTSGYRVHRHGKAVWEGGAVDSLKRFKDDVNKVAKGVEFGVSLPFPDVRVGDKISSFNMKTTNVKMVIKL